MAKADSIIRGLMNKGRAVRDIEEPWWSKRYGDVLGGIAELPQLYSKAKMWNERENTKRREVMGLIAGNVSNTYNPVELETRKKKLLNYGKDHSGKFDDTTSDIYQILIDSITTQENRNKDFMRLEAMGDSMQSEITKVVNGMPRSGEISTENAEKIKDLQKTYLDYSGEFRSSHGDRLESKQYQHISATLDNGERINRFLINSLYDDKKIDDVELQVFNQAWDAGDVSIIDRYNAKEDALLKGTIGSQVQRLTTAGTRYKQIQKIKNRTVPFKDPNTAMTYYFGQPGFPSVVESALITEEMDLKKEIKLLDDAHIKTMGTSFMDKEFPNLFKTTPFPPPKPKPKPKDPFPKIELEPEIKELPVSALSAWDSWQGASSSARSGGMSEFFDRDDIVNKPRDGGGTKSVLEFDASNLLSAYENRATKESVRKQLTKDSPVVRDLSKESGIKVQHVVDILEPKRKELAKVKDEYIVDVSGKKKPTEIKIKRDNKAIKDLAKTKRLYEGNYRNFADQVISGWESLDDEEKSKYNSFEDWVDKTLMKEGIKQEISIVR